MEIDGNTKTCILVGNPVAHTLSPVIHHELAKLTEINMTYIPCQVSDGSLENAIKGAYALNILGLNITVPYKEQVIPFLCEMDMPAERIGAVNTLVRQKDGYKGYNTDMPGLLRAMKSDGITIENEDVILLGAGGVARAVAVMLCDKVKHLYILNRTSDKAKRIVEEVNGYAGRNVAKAFALAEYGRIPEGKYLAIQATNVGMYPHTDEVIISDERFYEKIHTGYDLIYNPAETEFIKKVMQAGGKAYNGLKMLLFQGIIAFELWNGVTVTDTQAAYVYEKLRKNL